MTVQEVAERLGVDAGLVYRLIGRREIAHCRVGLGRGVIRVEESSVAEYLERKRRDAVQAVPERRAKRVLATPAFKHLPLD